MQIADSARRLPPSAFRLGITLTEVLISLGILTIGLLGVAALFPVGSYYLQKGEIADRGSAIAQSAFDDAYTRGMLSPKNWLAYAYTGDIFSSPQKWSAFQFDKPVVTAMQQSIAFQKTMNSTGNVANGADEISVNAAGQQSLNREFGSVYLIDPIGASSSVTADGSVLTPPNRDEALAIFPMMRQGGWLTYVETYLANSPTPWGSWRTNSPMIRVTLPIPNPLASTAGAPAAIPMDRQTAEQFFTSHDDLALDVPNQASKPSVQRWEGVDTDGDGKLDSPLARQSRGDYSWLITVSAPTIMARNALANPDFDSYNYDVSVVVFYKRTEDVVDPGLASDSSGNQAISAGELMVSSAVKSTGLAGGEMLLTANVPGADPFNKLKSGEWLMICGPHPQSTDLRPMFFAQWYRVLTVDKNIDSTQKETWPSGSVKPQRYVSLRGPQWPWQPDPTYTPTSLSNQLCAVITPGAVAVHKKTVRLEGNSAWSF